MLKPSRAPCLLENEVTFLYYWKSCCRNYWDGPVKNIPFLQGLSVNTERRSGEEYDRNDEVGAGLPIWL